MSRWTIWDVVMALLVGFAMAFALSTTASAASSEKVDEIPENLTRENVDSVLLRTVRDALPENRNVNADFLNPSYDPTLPVSKDAQVFVTFLDEGAGYRNSLGYYTHETGALDGLSKADVDTDGSGVVSLEELRSVDGVETGWVFPNSSKNRAGGRLTAGDTVTLGEGKTFEAGTTIGFYLVQNGWTGRGVRTPTGRTDTLPQVFYSADFLNPEADATATVLTDSSSNRSRHVAMLFASGERSEIVMGFEDLNRVDRRQNAYSYSTDEDFNDAVFLVTANPVDAFQTAEIATAPIPLLGSGLGGASLLFTLLGGSYVFNRRRRQSGVMAAVAAVLVAGGVMIGSVDPVRADPVPTAEGGACLQAFLSGDMQTTRDVCASAIRNEDPHALYVAGVFLESGSGMRRDLPGAASAYRRSAEAGVAVAQYALGVLYERGRGVSRDGKEAAKWYQAAADQEFPLALNNLARLTAEGEFVPRDPERAVALLTRAAEAGLALAQHNLGLTLVRADAPDPRFEEAIAWWRKAADQDYAPSQILLGLSFVDGLGVPTDASAAADWFRRAADQGSADGQFLLAGLYRRGSGVAEDPDRARALYLAAAQQGHPGAQYNLAVLLLAGDETARSDAQDWLRRAAANGFAPAEDALGRLLAARTVQVEELQP